MPGISTVLTILTMATLWAMVPVTNATAQTLSSRETVDTTPDLGLPRQADGTSADLLSAFHGLDALPFVSHRICLGSRGFGGMPVIFSTEIDTETLQAGDFLVTRASGETHPLHCVSVLPAVDPGELRTVLLIGDLGPSDSDPPVSVEIVGNIHSMDKTLNFRGARQSVVPLADGPSLTLAKSVDDWTRTGTLGPRRARGSLCPVDGTLQAVRVTWEGGVTLVDGSEPGEAERDLYSVTVEASDGSTRVITPFALADLGDGDNNHMLCLNVTDRPLSVAFPAGILTDPNDDPNPATSLEIRAAE